MSELNPPYATRALWARVALDILKYAIGAIVGAIGVSASGCTVIPFFNF